MNDSILISIKKLLGLGEDYAEFDQDIIMHINAIISNLVQMGVCPEKGFIVTDEKATWKDLMGSTKKLEQIKSYIYLKVKLLFDPPTNSAAIESMNKIASEFEWRMYIEKGGY